ncbi:hypothetical protein JCM16358_07050 [Halanaerocella petrolearia]
MTNDYELLLEIRDADDNNTGYALLKDENRYGIENSNRDSPYYGTTWKNSVEEMLDHVEGDLEQSCDDHIEENFIDAAKGKLKMMLYQQ